MFPRVRLWPLVAALLLARISTPCGAGDAELADAFATVQRDGRPYRPFYANFVAPHAVVEGDSVYCAWQDGEGRPMVAEYDRRLRVWSGPSRASDFGLGADTHGNPAIAVDNRGCLHVFYGCHAGPLRHARSTARRDPSSWVEQPPIAPDATYPQVMRMADGRLLLFYRAGSHLAPWVSRESSDGGAGWSAPRRLFEMRRDYPDRFACSYHAFVPGHGRRTVHCFWVYKDDDPGGNRRAHLGLREGVYRYNLYYAKCEPNGDWIAADGEPFDALPVNKRVADERALVFDSGERFCGIKRIVVDRNDRPHARLEIGVWDVKPRRVVVPSVTKYASFTDDGWRVDDEAIEDQPRYVRERLDIAGPLAFGGRQPSEWFVHYAQGPEGDPSKSYLWLSHLRRGVTPASSAAINAAAPGSGADAAVGPDDAP